MATPVPALPPIDVANDLTDLIRASRDAYFARYADWCGARRGDRARGTPEALWQFVATAHDNLATLVRHAATLHDANVALTAAAPQPKRAGR